MCNTLKKKKKYKNHMDILLMKNSVIILGILVRNYKSISVPHYTEQKLCQCHMELYSCGGCTGKRYQEYHSISSSMFPIFFWLLHSHRPLGPYLTCMFISNTLPPSFQCFFKENTNFISCEASPDFYPLPCSGRNNVLFPCLCYMLQHLSSVLTDGSLVSVQLDWNAPTVGRVSGSSL